MNPWTPFQCRQCQSYINRALNLRALLIALTFLVPCGVALLFGSIIAFWIVLAIGVLIDYWLGPLEVVKAPDHHQ